MCAVSMLSIGASAAARTRGPNAFTSRLPVRGSRGCRSRTSLVFPILRLVTLLARPGRSRDAGADADTSAARSVRLASSSGSPSRSASNSPCCRDRRIGSRLGR